VNQPFNMMEEGLKLQKASIDALCDICLTPIYPGLDGSMNEVCYSCGKVQYLDRDCDEPEKEE